ncbi:MAG: hypothetical protein ILM98_04420 [Kiritimatiellae bacterium]|nr:hypothetical protein [Kiritimatiellia bacterium]
MSAKGSSGEDCSWLDDVQWTPGLAELTLGSALDAPGLDWTTGGEGAGEWSAVPSPSWDGVDACAAYAEGAGGVARLATRVNGPGTVSFRWKVATGTALAGIAFMVDGKDVELCDSETWSICTLSVVGSGQHHLAWEFFWDGTPDGDSGFLDCVSWTPAGGGVLPELPLPATPETVTNAIAGAGFTDATAVMAAISGDSTKYAAFREWAQGVAGGETAVVASSNAAVSWLLGAEALFENEPAITITGLSFDDAGEATSSLNVTVEVKDGEDVVKVAAEKVASMFEATSDLRDWDGAAKLMPTVSGATRNADNTMTFTVTPGDGTATSAFLRIKVK